MKRLILLVVVLAALVAGGFFDGHRNELGVQVASAGTAYNPDPGSGGYVWVRTGRIPCGTLQVWWDLYIYGTGYIVGGECRYVWQ